jgi:hypothetical protein
MTSPSFFSASDATRSRLRTLVSTLEREMRLLPNQLSAVAVGSPPNRLAEAYTELVEQLALGPEPEVRACPTCGSIGMLAATRCSSCWTKLVPLSSPQAVVK